MGQPLTQEKEDIDIIRSWVEVGGHPAHQEEDAKELLTEVKYIPMSFSPPFFINLSATNFPSQSLIFQIVIGSFLLLYRV